jgi:hypothetical protein
MLNRRGMQATFSPVSFGSTLFLIFDNWNCSASFSFEKLLRIKGDKQETSLFFNTDQKGFCRLTQCYLAVAREGFEVSKSEQST